MSGALCLNGVKMRLTSGAATAAVSCETLFEFEQEGSTFSARYRGGAILDGYLIGQLKASNQYEFRYVQSDLSGILDAGHATGVFVRMPNSRLRMVENFQWSTRPEAGQNVYEEVRE